MPSGKREKVGVDVLEPVGERKEIFLGCCEEKSGSRRNETV